MSTPGAARPQLDAMHARQHELAQAAQEALQTLAGVAVDGHVTPTRHGGAPIAVAIGDVAASMGISVVVPRGIESLPTAQGLREIERASGFRTRKIVLSGQWWRKDCGSLVAFRSSDAQPVALIRCRRMYEAVDPVTGNVSPVDASTSTSLQMFAYSIYRPLPARIERPFDLLRFSVGGRGRDLIVLAATALATIALAMFTPIATAALIDSAIPNADRSLLMQIAFGLVSAALGAAVLDLTGVFATVRLTAGGSADAQAAVWDRLLKLRPSFLRRYSVGDLSSRAMAISSIYRRLNSNTVRTLFASVASLLNLALMFYFSPRLAILALAAAVLLVLITYACGRAMMDRLRTLQNVEGRLFGLTVQLINGIAKLRVSGSERAAFAYWGKRYADQQKLNLGLQRLRDYVSTSNQTVPVLVTAIVFLAMADSILNPPAGAAALSLGSFLAFAAATGAFFGSVVYLGETITDLLYNFTLWERAKPIVTEETETNANQADPGTLKGSIAISHVTFRYGNSGPLTLDDVSLHAEPGEFIALVGASGSGKSTIMRLLLGYEAPASGAVYYDGHDLKGANVAAIRRQLGVVMQNSSLLSGPIFENIAAGTSISLDRAWEAASRAGIADDIRALPMGMHTYISEGAGNISMGQRQRLLIARALVFDPRVLLLDEATSALDNRAQATVTRSLDALKVTRIVIAHRLSTIRNADRIYVLQAGRITESGTVAELAGAGGLFAELMKRQML